MWSQSRQKKNIHNCLSNFRQTGSAIKRKSTGRPQTATGLENVAAVRASTEQSPRRSARKHVDVLWLSDQSVWTILHWDLKMHLYKIPIAQELSERDCETHTTLCRELLQSLPIQLFCCLWTRHISTFQEQSTHKFSSTGLTITRYTNIVPNLRKLFNILRTARQICDFPFKNVVHWTSDIWLLRHVRFERTIRCIGAK
jgi:hypothetical protein